MEKAARCLLANECLVLKTEHRNTHLCPKDLSASNQMNILPAFYEPKCPSASEKSVPVRTGNITLCFILLIWTSWNDLVLRTL